MTSTGNWNIGSGATFTVNSSDICRNPVASERPTFSQILSVLLNNKEETLSIPIKDASAHPQACLLGASLEAGLEMYKDIQDKYLKKEPRPEQKRQTSTDLSAKRQSELTQNEYEVEENGDNFGETSSQNGSLSIAAQQEHHTATGKSLQSAIRPPVLTENMYEMEDSEGSSGETSSQNCLLSQTAQSTTPVIDEENVYDTIEHDESVYSYPK